MVLGVYWYFGFPEGLYSYDYFKWKPGYGGHANNPAQLETTVSCPKPEALISSLKSLIHEINQGFIYIYQNVKQLKIGTGSFNLHDFDFELMKKVELILKQHQVQLINDFSTKVIQPIKLHIKKDYSPAFPNLKLLKQVSSQMKKYNAETSLLRLDINIPLKEKNTFLNKLKKISDEENINVLFYLEKDVEESVNLMLFFGNGRQGHNFKEKQNVDAENLESKIIALSHQFGIDYQFKGSWDYYPKGDYNIVKIVDKEFII
ncbi:hypothetical protein ABWH96_16060 [Marivirga tractuosa]|uniref:hypothetical protein n=1 Tax=Marivirga tractuosa TaxID=1006 RepID=UPI0035CE9EB4